MSHESQPSGPTPVPTAGEGHFANTEIDPQLANFGIKQNTEPQHGIEIDVVGGDTNAQTIPVHSGLKDRLDTPVYKPLSDEELSQRRADVAPKVSQQEKRRSTGRAMLLSAVALAGAWGVGTPSGRDIIMSGANKASDKVLRMVTTGPNANNDLKIARDAAKARAEFISSQEAAIDAGASGNFEPPAPENPVNP